MGVESYVLEKRGALEKMIGFDMNSFEQMNSIKYRKRRAAGITLLALSLIIGLFFQTEKTASSLLQSRAVQQAVNLKEMTQIAVKGPEELIRFHVLANSDTEEDQALKRAVRDAILKEVSPRLAESSSLEESREILVGLRPEMEQISKEVIKSWGKDYSVTTDYGNFIFPTKSYGSLILPAGEYEAVRILIGEAKGSNWWCVLFPPLCFVDIEHSTAVAVDGKPGIPLDDKSHSKNQEKNQDKNEDKKQDKQDKVSTEKPKVRFWIIEFFARFFRG